MMEIEFEAPTDPIPGVHPLVWRAPAGLLFTRHKLVTLSTSTRLGGENRRGPQAPAAAGLARETGWAFVGVFK